MAIKRVYSVEETCYNCWKTIKLLIPFGTTVRSYLLKKTCPNCGCILGIKLNSKI